MEFLIYSADKPDSLHIRQSARDAHLAWLKSPSEIKLLVAGPWLDDDGVMRGSLLIVEAESKAAVMDWLSGDPYKAADLTASVDVKAYKWVIGKAS